MATEYRIGIDGRALMGAPAGVGRYVVELCRCVDLLLPDARFLVYAPGAIAMPVNSGRWSPRIDRSWPARIFNRGLWLIAAAGRRCRRDRLDAFWGTVTLMPPLGRGVRAVTTVYDLNHRIVPSTMRARDLWARRLLFRRSIVRADHVIAISRGTAARIHSLYGRIATVVTPGVSAQFRPQPASAIERCLGKYGLRRPYLLAVGTREPRKNFELLAEVFVRMKSEGQVNSHRLVLAGARGWKDRRLGAILEAAASAGLSTLDYVAQEDLPALYSGADALLCPSLYEGFGMPVLEARACGTPIVASDCPELREAGGDGAVYVQPDAAGLRDGIAAALSLTRGPAPRGLPNWEDGARTLARVLRGEITAAS